LEEGEFLMFSERFEYRWLVVAAGTCLTLLFGIFLSFGVFLDPLIIEFGWSKTLTSMVFSIYTVSYSLSTILMGKLADKLGSRIVIAIGGVLASLGIIISSQTNAIWQLYLTFGVMGGIGAASFWIPSTLAVIKWFRFGKNLNLAISIVSVGTGLGTLLISPIAGFLIAEYGWRVCYLFMGALSGSFTLFAVLLMRDPQKSDHVGIDREETLSQPSGLNILEALKTKNFWSLFTVFLLGGGIARNTIMVYIVSFSSVAGFPFLVGTTCLALIGGGSIIGRIFSGFLSRKLAENRIVFICFLLQGLSTFVFILVQNIWIFYLSSLIFGIMYGGYVPQFPILTNEFFGVKSYGLIYGVISCGYGLGTLIGPPLLGGYLSNMVGSYFLSFFLSAIFSIIAGATAFLIRPKTKSQLKDHLQTVSS
jgi:OFA family oxalate/formate antiporter-like MFS transporter